MQHITGLSVARSQHTVTSVAAIAAALCLVSACMSIRTPRSGKPVTLQPGEALVFGRIRMLNAKNEHLEYSAFRFDPWDQPFFGPGPRMTLELRQLHPTGGAVKYKTHLSPSIEKNGAFFWILSSGDYVLLGNPRLLGSKQFSPAETETLAHFSVPASGGTIYLGTLIISVVFDFGNVIQGWSRDEAEYAIRSCRVVDELDQAVSQLRERFPAFPEPVGTEPMRTE